MLVRNKQRTLFIAQFFVFFAIEPKEEGNQKETRVNQSQVGDFRSAVLQRRYNKGVEEVADVLYEGSAITSCGWKQIEGNYLLADIIDIMRGEAELMVRHLQGSTQDMWYVPLLRIPSELTSKIKSQ